MKAPDRRLRKQTEPFFGNPSFSPCRSAIVRRATAKMSSTVSPEPANISSRPQNSSSFKRYFTTTNLVYLAFEVCLLAVCASLFLWQSWHELLKFAKGLTSTASAIEVDPHVQWPLVIACMKDPFKGHGTNTIQNGTKRNKDSLRFQIGSRTARCT